MKKVLRSTVLGVLTLLLPLPLFSSILYFTEDGKSNPGRIFYTYTCNDGYSIVIAAFFLASPLWALWKCPSDEENNCNAESMKDEDKILDDHDNISEL